MTATADEVQVGACDEHVGVHVKDTYEYGDGNEWCRDFVAVPGFKHECSDVGNAFGGYNCTCGEPWLTRGCMTGASGTTTP